MPTCAWSNCDWAWRSPTAAMCSASMARCRCRRPRRAPAAPAVRRCRRRGAGRTRHPPAPGRIRRWRRCRCARRSRTRGAGDRGAGQARHPARPRRQPAKYLHAIATHDINFGVGPAGTGKTFLAVAMAVDALERNARAAHPPGAPGGGGGREARLPARRPDAEGRSLPASAVRRALRDAGRGEGRALLEKATSSRSRRSPTCAGAR
jgi:hypothetical protein